MVNAVDKRPQTLYNLTAFFYWFSHNYYTPKASTYPDAGLLLEKNRFYFFERGCLNETAP